MTSNHELVAQRAAELLQDNEIGLANDHFVLTSGRHSGEYVDKNRLYTLPGVVTQLCVMLRPLLPECDIIVGSAQGGIILAYQLAKCFNCLTGEQEQVVQTTVRSMWADLGGSHRFRLKRGYDIEVRDKRVLVVDDVLTTGHSLIGTIGAVKDCGGRVVAAAVLYNRGRLTHLELGVSQLISLIHTPLVSWIAKDCPLCKRGIPVNTRLGHGEAFVRKHTQMQIPRR